MRTGWQGSRVHEGKAVRYFCTYLDQRYLPRGLALYQSLRHHCANFRLWILCMDRESHAALSDLAYEGIHPIALEEFEEGDPVLAASKNTRSRIEYYFTCTPSLPLYVLKKQPAIDLITYVDADLFFYSNLEPLFTELGKRSISLIEHRFAEHLRRSDQCGIYNVGWLSFRRDAWGLACLHWWRERCIEWCYDRVEPDRYADQKYLNQWPSRFENVAVLQHKGANLAPWNVGNYHLRRDSRGVWVDEFPLVFYHFHALKQITRWLFNSNLAVYGVPRSPILREHVYWPYIRTLLEETQKVSSYIVERRFLSRIRTSTPCQSVIPLVAWIKTAVRDGINLLNGVRTGNFYIHLGTSGSPETKDRLGRRSAA